MILVGITTIRFGLWIFDLAISQLFQMSVPEPQRNTVGGIQSSLNGFFDCFYIILTVIMSDPSQFHILIAISCIACIGSCIIYICWFIKTGGLKEEKRAPEASKTTCELEEENNHKNTVYKNPTEQDEVNKTKAENYPRETKEIAINGQAIDDI